MLRITTNIHQIACLGRKPSTLAPPIPVIWHPPDSPGEQLTIPFIAAAPQICHAIKIQKNMNLGSSIEAGILFHISVSIQISLTP